MKNKKIQIIILFVLILITGYLVITNRKGTIKPKLRDFAIEDTASVSKIFMADKDTNTILLERKKGYWSVNTNYEARQDLVGLLLKTLYRMRVKEPVAKAAQANIIKSLAVKSVKVEIYQNNRLTKTMYVGGPTMDSYGTYMILDKSSAPFIMEIPGFRGYLSPRFTTLINDWRSQTVFRIPMNEIKKVTLENIKTPVESFAVTQNNESIGLKDYKNQVITSFDTIEVRKFLLEFRHKNFSKFIEDVPDKWQDSIKTSEPMYLLTIEKTDGSSQWIKAFNKPGWGKTDFFGKELKSDPDNFFMLTDKNDFVYAQYFSFDPVFKKISDFKK